MANTFRSLFGREDNNAFISLLISRFKNSIETDPAIPLIIVSLGILLTASSGSWDITNHLLNRPETFFSPPHAGLYSGVVLVLFVITDTVAKYLTIMIIITIIENLFRPTYD